MNLAIGEAKKAFDRGEVPVGAVFISQEGQLLGLGHNLVEANHDASAHAELLAMAAAGRTHGDWRLNGSRLVVTLEPCPMCTSALVLARVAEIYFGAPDPRLGACGSIFDLASSPQLPHQIKTYSGVLEKECKALLNDFFQKLRRGGREVEGA